MMKKIFLVIIYLTNYIFRARRRRRTARNREHDELIISRRRSKGIHRCSKMITLDFQINRHQKET
jgi:hypothetical protein